MPPARKATVGPCPQRGRAEAKGARNARTGPTVALSCEAESAATPGRWNGSAAMQSRPRQTSSRRSRHGGVAGNSPLEWGAGDSGNAVVAPAWGKSFPHNKQVRRKSPLTSILNNTNIDPRESGNTQNPFCIVLGGTWLMPSIDVAEGDSTKGAKEMPVKMSGVGIYVFLTISCYSLSVCRKTR